MGQCFVGGGLSHLFPKNLVFVRKMMALPESGAAAPSPQPPGLYAYDANNNYYY